MDIPDQSGLHPRDLEGVQADQPPIWPYDTSRWSQERDCRFTWRGGCQKRKPGDLKDKDRRRGYTSKRKKVSEMTRQLKTDPLDILHLKAFMCGGNSTCLWFVYRQAFASKKHVVSQLAAVCVRDLPLSLFSITSTVSPAFRLISEFSCRS